MKYLQTFLAALVLLACQAQAQQIVLKGLSPQDEGNLVLNPAISYQYKYRGDTAKFQPVGFWGQHFAPVVKQHEEADLAMQRFRDNRVAGALTGGAAVLAFSGFVLTALNSGSGDAPGLFLLGTLALSGTSYYLFYNSNKHIEEAAREFNKGSAMYYPQYRLQPNYYGSQKMSGINIGFSFNF